MSHFNHNLQAEKQLELQMFKLYYNEREIEELQEELGKRNDGMKKETRKREKIEEEIREKKKEQGALSRELTKIDQDIKQSVSVAVPLKLAALCVDCGSQANFSSDL